MDLSVNIMKKMSDLFTRAWLGNSYIIDNSNLNVIDFPFHQYLIEEYGRVFRNQVEGFEFGYNMTGGGVYLREQIAKHETSINHVNISSENIVVSGSGVTGVFSSIFNFFGAQDKRSIMFPTPIYSGIPCSINYFGLKWNIVSTKSENDFLMTFSDVESSYTEDTICLIITNPSNPVCKFMDPIDLQKILEFCIDKNIYVIVDAIFEEAPGVNNTIPPYFSMVNGYDRFIKIKGVSKDLLHTNDFRLGWSICGNEEFNENIRLFNNMLNCSNSRLAEQIVAFDYADRVKEGTIIGYVNQEKEVFRELVTSGIKNLVQYLERQPLVVRVITPDCGNIIYFQFDDRIKKQLNIKSSEELSIWILEHAKVLFTSNEFFFHDIDQLWMRMTYCFSYTTMIELLDRVFSELSERCK